MKSKAIDKSSEKEPWQIAVARFCVQKSETGFDYDELREFVNTHYNVADGHILAFFREEIQTPTGRNLSRDFVQGPKSGKWTPPLDLVSKITDYDELQEARANAQSASELSRIAIGLSVLAMIVSAVVPWAIANWMTQDVQVKNSQCFMIDPKI